MLAHSLLGGCSRRLSILCPSVVSVLVATPHACLWSSFRWCSESPLLAHPETTVSCLLGSCRLFPDSLPANCGTLAPFRLCSHSQPQSSPWDLTSEARASGPRPHLSRRVSRQASQSGECWLALILCAGISPLCPLHPCCCALLPGSETSHPAHPLSLPVKGLPSVWKLFLFHGSLSEVQVLSLFFCLCVFFFLLPYPGTWGVFCLMGSLRSSASV